MKIFTARTLPIFEQCFGENKEFFNSLLEHLTVTMLSGELLVKVARAVRAIGLPSLPASLARIQHGQTKQKLTCADGYNKKKALKHFSFYYSRFIHSVISTAGGDLRLRYNQAVRISLLHGGEK